MATRQDKLFRHLVSALEKLELRYFITGSVAAIYYGEPRLTNDIDVVVDLSQQQIEEFYAEFPLGEFYLSEEALNRAVKQRGMCNVIHTLRHQSRYCYT